MRLVLRVEWLLFIMGVGTLSSIQPAEEYAFPGWQEKPYSQIRNEEYIRKDALLEWAKEHYTGMDITKRDMWDGGYNCAMKQLIDKLNSM